MLDRVDALKAQSFLPTWSVHVTRQYGETAAEKSNELLFHMLIAVVSVSVLIALTLGLRESLIVFTAIPVTLALTLTVFYLYGYTLNRITLFALIFSIGILVDDAIVVVENIVRHSRLPESKGMSIRRDRRRAVDEVGNPTILATLTVIAAILPMAFVSGLMGPYMRPIPIGATAAMVFSLVVAFVVTPWAAVRILKPNAAGHGQRAGRSPDALVSARHGIAAVSHICSDGDFSALVAILLLGSMSLVYIGFVKVKMLPFDNKSEFQVIIDMPNGTTLEETARVAKTWRRKCSKQPEVVNVQTYAGTASPYNFNGLVRHYYLRAGAERRRYPGEPSRQARAQSAKPRDRQAVRARLQPIADRYRRAHQGRRSAARPAGAPDAGRRSLRSDAGGPAAHRAADSRPLQEDRRRCRCRLVRGGRPAEAALRRRQREGRAQRHHGRRHRAHDAYRVGR